MKIKAVLIAVLLLITAACTTTQVADQAQAAVALLDLRSNYDQISADLTEQLDTLPTETAVLLLDLQEKTDAYVQRLSVAWKMGLTPTQLDSLYIEGKALYNTGEALLLPIADLLPPKTWAALAQFQAQAAAVDALYLQIKSGDQQTREMIRAGIGLATLALKIGMMSL